MTNLKSGKNINNSDHPCDFCEKKVAYSQIHQIETRLLLCPDCRQYMETLPRVLEESVERFLLGNVI